MAHSLLNMHMFHLVLDFGKPHLLETVSYRLLVLDLQRLLLELVEQEQELVFRERHQHLR